VPDDHGEAGNEADHFDEQQEGRAADQCIDGLDRALFLRDQRQRRDDAVKPDELAEKDRQRRHAQLHWIKHITIGRTSPRPCWVTRMPRPASSRRRLSMNPCAD
jgi:hypothetical protein